MINAIIKKLSIKFYQLIDFLRFNFFFNKKNFAYLFLISDSAKWVLDSNKKLLSNFLKKNYKFNFLSSRIIPNSQIVYFLDQYQALKKNALNKNNKIAIDYQHGIAKFSLQNKKLLKFLKNNQEKITLFRVTNSYFKKYLLKNGFDKKKILIIPNAISYNFFNIKKTDIRDFKLRYKIPSNYFVIGSFQKDGNGWGKGNTPKYIKGPDIFIKTLKILKKKINNLFVLLTGPARGYVINQLIKNKIKFLYLKNLNDTDIKLAYRCLNLYIVSSRDEGGPMSIFESMASNVPIVSTKVGHANDQIKNYYNGFKVNINDYRKLAEYSFLIFKKKKLRNKLIKNGKKTATKNLYDFQKKKWDQFFKILFK